MRNLEQGQATPALPTLIYLALALGDLTGDRLRLSDLLGDAQTLKLGPGDQRPVTRAWLDRVLEGHAVELSDADYSRDSSSRDPYDEFDEELEHAALQKMRELSGHKLTATERADQVAQLLDESQMPPQPEWDREDGEAPASLAEERAAKKLGIETGELQRRAIQLWERPLEEESARRAGAGSTPQARGRVTRVLVDEIREAAAKEV
ncbi:hypothetical protein BJY26_000374 [Spelaeicoccus albus]|uniref:Uncharacterized protein n=1 Tax=Spelaeicoccus albus TaxID=1280376 RepID=A0A7Z0D0Z2_9MICO|nr:hypothetical protein [Spelaeicoccus albus]